MKKMTDLRLPKKTPSKDTLAPPSMDEPRYPYGTTVTLDKDTIAKMPDARNLRGGEMVELSAMAKVVQVRIVDKDGSRDTESIELQIQKLAVARDADEEYSAGFDSATAARTA